MIFYAVIKFVAYCLWCSLGLHLLAPTRARFGTSITYGTLRWLLGLGFGIAVGVALGSVSSDSVAMLYVSVYAPLRVIEWTIMAVLIRRLALPGSGWVRSPRLWLWVIGGIVVSFVSDLASPEGMAGRFCVGRCLC